jgi:hypothetical protein
MRSAVVLVLLLLVLLACGARALAALGGGDGESLPPPAEPGVGCAQRAPGETCGVLFVGNSLTFVNDLPRTFARLAASAGRAVRAVPAANAGETLAQHVARGDVTGPLAADTFNVVVIQEQSQIPSVPELRAGEMYPAARTLAAAARAEPAQPVLFSSWAHADGWPDHGLIGFAPMQAALDEGYATLARSLHVPVAPVGAAFTAARADAAVPPLVGDDGYHPSPAGTYLAACVFYATIFGHSPQGLGFAGGLYGDTAARLQGIAARVVLG